MKQTLLFTFLLFGFTLFAQDITIEPVPSVAEENVDLTDMFQFVKAQATMTNTSSSSVSYKWTVRQISGPTEWSFAFCDNNACYPYGTESNINPNGNGPNEPLVVPAGGTSVMDLQARHNGIPGAGVIEVDMATERDPTTVLSTGVYEITMNGVVSSIEQKREFTYKVFPNPADDYFTVATEAKINRVELYNVVGRKVRTYESNLYNRYDVRALPDGIYLIRMKDKDGMTLRTTRLIKRAARP